MRSWLLAAFVAMLVTGPAAAHKPSDAYLRLTIEPGGAPQGSLDVALRDLELVVGLDGNGDGAITWGELKARHPAIAAYVQSRLVLSTAVGPCELRPIEHGDFAPRIPDDAQLLESAGRFRHSFAAHTEHVGDEFLCHRQLRPLQPVQAEQQPAA